MSRAALLVFFLMLAPPLCGLSRAQDTVSEVIGFLVTNQAVPTADFEKDRAAAEVARAAISRALLVNLTSVPLATSSSGFLYRLNPQLGTVERATESFGGFFVERALTSGRGRTSLGVAASSSAYDRLDGHALRDGTLVTVANRFRDETASFITESLTLRISTSTLTLFGSIGITDRLEIGGAVPFVRLMLDGRRVNVYRGETLLQASGTAATSGVGDLAMRAKYTIVAGRGGGVAAAAEMRLPTGDDRNLLGAGAVSLRFMGIGSYEEGRLALHANASLARGGVSSEAAFAGAASVAVRPRVTVSGELLARRVSELHNLALTSAPHPGISGVDTLRLSPGASATTVSSAVAGVKVNVTRTLVLGGHLRWPLMKRGLTAPVTPTVAVEYAF
jgi:hypothetical protein